jgi:phosphate transport system permease protein
MSDTYFAHAAVAAEKLALPTPGSGSRTRTWGAWLFVWGVRSCAAVAAIITLLIVVFLCAQSLPVLREIELTRFFTDQTWAPTRGHFNLLPMMVGTLYTTVGAVLLAGPCGLALAIFALFYAPPVMARLLHGVLGLLAGIPSVVFGLWGLVTLVPLLNHFHQTRAYVRGVIG